MTIKFKGKAVEVNSVVIGTINGWRNPNGVDHKPYTISLINGQCIKQFSYCSDARSWCRTNEAVLAKLAADKGFDVKQALGLV
jgi:hypothetical protein